jgi:7-cyano-7-deazaguanine synthase
MKTNKALVIFSGGQDSTTCLFWALKKFDQVEVLTFDYGQRHSIEIEIAKSLARLAQLSHTVMDLRSLNLFGSNALTDSQMIIESHVTMPNTFVPARNLVFLTLAASFAQKKNIDHLVIGACEADFSGYPDCRDQFMQSFEQTLNLAVGKTDIQVHTPLMWLTKAEIFKLAQDLGCLETIIYKTHTCYEGNRETFNDWGYGCGNCPSCQLRKKGFESFRQSEKDLNIPVKADF